MEDVWLLDASAPADVERYLRDQAVVAPDALPISVERAGAGNMNLTLRVRTRAGSLIVKQGRPWVEKYPQFAAPPDRTLVEAAFYEAVASSPAVSAMMPAVRHVDRRNRVIALEDLGAASDCTDFYKGKAPSMTSLTALLGWLESLTRVVVKSECRAIFANRAMRALNHEHIFDVPLRPNNGLDLDALTPGLAAEARAMAADSDFRAAVAALGHRYLADGTVLVHGDYFPGSWLETSSGLRVIDPEFCFLGDPEFDCGVMAAHLAMGGCDQAVQMVCRSLSERRLDAELAARFMGVEIMRRLIGVAQLPLPADLNRKRSLLALSRRLLLEPGKGPL